MTNVERRKTRKYAGKVGKHVTPELRKANKVGWNASPTTIRCSVSLLGSCQTLYS